MQSFSSTYTVHGTTARGESKASGVQSLFYFWETVWIFTKKGSSWLSGTGDKSTEKPMGSTSFIARCLVTDDPAIIKEVFIKQFNSFTENGTKIPLASTLYTRSVLRTKGDVWRRQRHTLTPSFSASKLKQMARFINRCCDNLLVSLTKTAKTGKPLDAKKAFGCYSLDVIAGTGFSVETNSLEEDGNAFLAAVAQFFSLNINRLPIAVASMFPVLEPVMTKLGFRSTGESVRSSIDFISQTLRQLKDDRTQSQRRDRLDFLQLMVDSEAPEEFIKDHPNDRYLSAEEILSQGFIMFVAGYETTSALLQYMSYCLAMHPDVQERLHDEIVAAIGDELPTYDNVSKISYLDSCIFECLRIFPPVYTVSRLAEETCCVEGVTIRAGDGVMVSTYTLGRDSDLYPQPDTFNPDRFEEGGGSSHVPTMIKELPFGCGPRQCIGMRLALYEAKMAMATLVRKVRFLRIPETPARIAFKTGTRMSTPEPLILVGLQLRH